MVASCCPPLASARAAAVTLTIECRVIKVKRPHSRSPEPEKGLWQGRLSGKMALRHGGGAPIQEAPSPWRTKRLSLSRLNHGLPRSQVHPEVMRGTAAFHDQIADTLLPQADPVLHDAAVLDTPVDVLDAQPTLVECLVGPLLLQGEVRTVGLLRRHEDRHVGERERQEAQSLQQPTSDRKWVGGGLRDAQIMHAAAVRRTQKEDREQGVDQQDIFYRVVFFLAAITCGLFRRVLGADDPSFCPVMGKEGTLLLDSRVLYSNCVRKAQPIF